MQFRSHISLKKWFRKCLEFSYICQCILAYWINIVAMLYSHEDTPRLLLFVVPHEIVYLQRFLWSNGHFAAQEEQRPLSEFLHSYESDHLSHWKSQIRGNNQATTWSCRRTKRATTKQDAGYRLVNMLSTKYGLHVDFFKFGLGSGKHETLQMVSHCLMQRCFVVRHLGHLFQL